MSSQEPLERQIQELRTGPNPVPYREIAERLPVSPTTAWRIQKKNETGPNRVLRERGRLPAVSPGLLLAAALLLLAAASVAFTLYRELAPPAPAPATRITVCVHRTARGSIDGFTSGAGGCPAGWHAVELGTDSVPAG